MIYKICFIFLVFCLNLFSVTLPFDLKYPTVIKEQKSIYQKYNKLKIYYNKQNKISYGETWYQKFKYKKTDDKKYFDEIKEFFVRQLGINSTDINKKGKGHFFINNQEYWLDLNVFVSTYSFTLLKVGGFENIVTFDKNSEYKYLKKSYKDKYALLPKTIFIPFVEDFAIQSFIHNKYNEKKFIINRKSIIKKGEYWKVNFKKISDDKTSYRYIIAHSYKEKIKDYSSKILEDEDNKVFCEIDYDGAKYFIVLNSYDNSFNIEIIKEKEFEQTLILSPDKVKSQLDEKGKIVLDGIFFDFDKSTLKKESHKTILLITSLMQRYSDLKIDIQGHTDNKGDDKYNLELSTKRALSVKNAIIEQGIDKKRIVSHGFGELKPIDTNDTEEGRAKNRRVEIHKVSGGNKKAIIDIDFIKPIPNSKITFEKDYPNDDLNIRYTKPYSKNNEIKEYKGLHKLISYQIITNGKIDKSFSRVEIISNYENILFLYNAKIVGKNSNDLYFEIEDRGDGKKIYGKIEAYSGSYNIRFLVEN